MAATLQHNLAGGVVIPCPCCRVTGNGGKRFPGVAVEQPNTRTGQGIICAVFRCNHCGRSLLDRIPTAEVTPIPAITVVRSARPSILPLFGGGRIAA